MNTTEQYDAKETFVRAFDTCADDIFDYCSQKTSSHDSAVHLSRIIFRDAWDAIVSSPSEIKNPTRIIWQKAHEHVNTFLSVRDSQAQYTSAIWNMTLSQR